MLTRWDPFAEIARLQDQVTRWMASGWDRPFGAFAPAVDIYEDQDAIFVKAELPGVKVDDVQIDVENNVLTLSGERKLEKEDQREGYHRIERQYGSFSRSFALPDTVDPDNVEAEMSEGILTVRLAKRPTAHRKRIEIRADGSRKAVGGNGNRAMGQGEKGQKEQPKAEASAGKSS